ncbi:MAG: EF-P lysine aminoacylase GenX [Hyphomicrobiales bacterium]|nr:EF-P lysine aminoacylase GenX [Hyphomicrobiales bacterium]
MEAASPWWDKTTHADRRPLLLARNAVKRAIRAHFEAQDFVEVEAASLQVSPGNETHLHALAVDCRGADGVARRRFLHTSPEFSMKKLVAAGEEKIFDFARVWRDREGGPTHAIEFTMLEWYRAGAPYETLMGDCADLLRLAADTVGAREFRHRGRACDPRLPPERITCAEAFDRFARIDLLATLPRDPTAEPDRDAFAASARACGVAVAEDDTWSDVFSRILAEKIEPALGDGRAVVLMDYPSREAALARPSPQDPRVAERFELWACGLELANAFGELTDPFEQRRRFDLEMAAKQRIYGERYPIDEDFLAALAHMPPTSGIALGFDRLVMLATGAPRLADVVWTPLA